MGALRASGALDALLGAIRAGVGQLSLDARWVDALPTALIKPFSGGGARGMMVETMKDHGADSFAGRLSCVIQGSTETTFYVLAVYFGSVGVKKTRHALACALAAEFAGVLRGDRGHVPVVLDDGRGRGRLAARRPAARVSRGAVRPASPTAPSRPRLPWFVHDVVAVEPERQFAGVRRRGIGPLDALQHTRSFARVARLGRGAANGVLPGSTIIHGGPDERGERVLGARREREPAQHPRLQHGRAEHDAARGG